MELKLNSYAQESLSFAGVICTHRYAQLFNSTRHKPLLREAKSDQYERHTIRESSAQKEPLMATSSVPTEPISLPRRICQGEVTSSLERSRPKL